MKTAVKTERFEKMVDDLRSILMFAFRNLRPDAREESVAEAMGLAFKNWRSLASKGREGDATAHTLARYAARQVRDGRSIGSSANWWDVLHMHPQRRRELGIGFEGDEDMVYDLVDSRTMTPADAAAFRVDFAEWKSSLSKRDREIVRRFMAGYSGGQIAKIVGMSTAGVNKVRQRLEASWWQFQGVGG